MAVAEEELLSRDASAELEGITASFPALPRVDPNIDIAHNKFGSANGLRVRVNP